MCGTLLKYKKVSTKKEHKCFGCWRVFQPKTEMIAFANLDGAIFVSGYKCQDCEDLLAAESKIDPQADNCIMEGSLRGLHEKKIKGIENGQKI